jgi:G:T-mismatch repair DNA endonuclease (very short patch repair protein)
VKTRKQIGYNMSKVRCSGSRMGRTLGSALLAAGVRYRKQCKKLQGCPDFAIVFGIIAMFAIPHFDMGTVGQMQRTQLRQVKISGFLRLKVISAAI